MKNLKIKQRRKNPEIVTKRLTSELLTTKDFDYLRSLFSIKEIHDMMGTDIKNKFWIMDEYYQMLIEKGPFYVWFYKNEPIGVAGFYQKGFRTAELIYMLSPKYWRMGFATEIVNALVDEAEEKNLKVLTLLIHPDNKNSINVAMKTGFQFKGVKSFKSNLDHLEFIQEL